MLFMLGYANAYLYAQHYPINDEKLLLIGQDLNSVSTVSIEEEFDPGLEIKLFPNPSQHLVHLQGEEESYAYTLLNQKGQEVLKGEGLKVDIQAFPAGIYLLKIGPHTAKIIKQ